MYKFLKIQTFYDPIFGFVKIIFPQKIKNKHKKINLLNHKKNV